MKFNYENSTWGSGTASLNCSDPTAFRLSMSLKSLPKTGRVLEIGCGAGQFIRAIKKRRQELECCGCDISKSAIQKAKSVFDGVEYNLSEEGIFPYENSSIDTVLIYDVLEHVDNPDEILKEVRRVLKNGGQFYMFVPCEGDWLSFWNFLRKIGIGKGLTRKYAGHISYFTRKNIYDILKKYELTVISKRFSEHIIGQKIGVLSFFLMDRYAKKNSLDQVNNEAYFKKVKLGFLRGFVNSVVYFESWVLQYLPSPNLHIISVKNKVNL